MTEESDDQEDMTALIVHPLPWRSESTLDCVYIIPNFLHSCCILVFKNLIIHVFSLGLNTFIASLDKRYADRVKGGVLMAKKIRKIGQNSKSLPPLQAPDWTLSQAWKGIG